MIKLGYKQAFFVRFRRPRQLDLHRTKLDGGDLTDRKILQSHKLNFFTKQRKTFLTRSYSLKQYNIYRQ